MEHARSGERGSILVLALLVSAASAIAGMWMVLTSDLGVRRNRYLVRAFEASRVSQGGLQLARERLGADPAWTSAIVTDPVDPTQVLTVSVQSVAYKYVQATSVGAVADSTQIVTADLRAVSHPSLWYQAVSSGTITFLDSTVGGFLRANSNVLGEGDVDFSGSVETMDRATVTDQIDPKQVVKVSEALAPPPIPIDDYVRFSSPLLSLPYDDDEEAYVLEKSSLTPLSNPFGAANAEGAYSIDGKGAAVVLRDVYIVGSLTIYNVTEVRIERGYSHRNAVAYLATLLVEGPILMSLESPLVELVEAYDYNQDGDLLDVHPPEVEGVIHAYGSFTGPYGGTVRGVILANEVLIGGNASLQASPSLLTQPIVGYVLPGSWEIVAGSIGRGS